MSEASGPNVDVPLSVKTSDLPVRTASAIVMLAIFGTALWLGGWFWTAFVALLSLGVLWEWALLIRVMRVGSPGWVAWSIAAIVYVGLGAWALIATREIWAGLTLAMVLTVILTDVGAYFAGRTIGGPKIAPSISPSKTWAGLLGGMGTAALVMGLIVESTAGATDYLRGIGLVAAIVAAILAVVAQVGDFFESWMKRRAGVKDSGRLLPGHGGLFDRVDGIIAVSFVTGLFGVATAGFQI